MDQVRMIVLQCLRIRQWWKAQSKKRFSTGYLSTPERRSISIILIATIASRFAWVVSVVSQNNKLGHRLWGYELASIPIAVFVLGDQLAS